MSSPAIAATAQQSQALPLRIAVGIATRGRPLVLAQTLADLSQQSVTPTEILVAYLDESDIVGAVEQFPEVHFLRGIGGTCAQRNLLLDRCGIKTDIVLFMDDDFYLQKDFLRRMQETFIADASVVGATGVVLADGAKGPGLTVEKARDILAPIASVPSLEQSRPFACFNTYGCNMAFRMAALRRTGIRFDEQLPAYGWYEDLDFSRQLLPHGRLVCVPGAQGVHLGVKVGRTSGKRLGYSQVINPVYLARKGTYPWNRAGMSILRNFAANLFRSLRPEPYIDRRGRIRGNLLALFELCSGKARPDRILELH